MGILTTQMAGYLYKKISIHSVYRSYVYEPGTFKPMALLKGHGTTHEVYYYQLDHLGTPQELTDPDGKIA